MSRSVRMWIRQPMRPLRIDIGRAAAVLALLLPAAARASCTVSISGVTFGRYRRRHYRDNRILKSRRGGSHDYISLGGDQKLTVKIKPPEPGSLVSVTVVRGAGIADGEAARVHTPRADRMAASGWASNGRAAMEQEALTVALTPRLDVVAAANAGAILPHVITTARATRRIALTLSRVGAGPSAGSRHRCHIPRWGARLIPSRCRNMTADQLRRQARGQFRRTSCHDRIDGSHLPHGRLRRARRGVDRGYSCIALA